MKPWKLAGNSTEASGEFKQFDRLTLVRIYDVGKLVGRDQPQVSLHMLLEFMLNGKLLDKDNIEDETAFEEEDLPSVK